MSDEQKDWQEPWEPGDPVFDSPLPENTEEWEIEEGVGEEPMSPDDVDEILGDSEGLDEVLREIQDVQRAVEHDITSEERARRILGGDPSTRAELGTGRSQGGPEKRLGFERLEGRQGNEEDDGENFS